jgi:hypothetical protein
MSEKGQNITTAVRQMTKLYESISLLLKSAEEELNAMGWEATNNLVMGEGSGAINGFRRWAPHYLFRFLPAKTEPKQMVFLSVVLDDINDANAVTEPVFGIGWFKYKPGAEKADVCWRHAKQLPLKMDPLGQAPASWQELDLKDVAEAEAFGIVEAKIFAVPLVSVTDSDQLLEQLVKPLAEKLGDVHVDSVDEKSGDGPSGS